VIGKRVETVSADEGGRSMRMRHLHTRKNSRGISI
jgi:hypothetical protein